MVSCESCDQRITSAPEHYTLAVGRSYDLCESCYRTILLAIEPTLRRFIRHARDPKTGLKAK